MNKSHALTIAAIASLSGISTAGDIFDSPGPGYRQQIERLSPSIDRTSSVRLRIEQPRLLSPSFPSPASDFSQPIRLFISPQSPAALGAPILTSPKNPK